MKAANNNTGIWFVGFLVYLSFINFFVIRTTPEVIAIQFALAIAIFKKYKFASFTKTWVPLITMFLFYEFLRGFADDLALFGNTTLFWIYELENKLFSPIPTITLQKLFLNSKFIINLSLLFYSAFFYYSFFVGFVIWLKDTKRFRSYGNGFLLLSYLGLLMFFLIPTAPPWMVAKLTDLHIERSIFQTTILNNLSRVTLYSYFIYGNPVAALPSLHVAWPTFTSIYLIRNYRRKIFYLTLIVPIMIGFSVVLTGEHFLLDIIAGWVMAETALFLTSEKNSKKISTFFTKKILKLKKYSRT